MSSKAPRKGTSRGETLAQLAPYLSLGWQLALTIVVSLGIGFLVDRWLGTTPLFLIIGALFGLIGVFWQIYQIAQEASAHDEEDEAPTQ